MELCTYLTSGGHFCNLTESPKSWKQQELQDWSQRNSLGLAAKILQLERELRNHQMGGDFSMIANWKRFFFFPCLSSYGEQIWRLLSLHKQPTVNTDGNKSWKNSLLCCAYQKIWQLTELPDAVFLFEWPSWVIYAEWHKNVHLFLYNYAVYDTQQQSSQWQIHWIVL